LLERPQGLLARALQDADVDAGELSAALQSGSSTALAQPGVRPGTGAVAARRAAGGQPRTGPDPGRTGRADPRCCNPMRYAGSATSRCWPN
jgi:hypothetical protein